MNKFKYPRTPHLPWSDCITSDDKKLTSDKQFHNQIVLVTEKMDGENTTIARNYIHARSLDSKIDKTRSWIANYAANFQWALEEDERICGENLYAKHNIFYNNLKSFFLAFSVWKNETCLSWKETEDFLSKLKIPIVPIIYYGIYNKEKIIETYLDYSSNYESEGYVIRNENSFHKSLFQLNIAKYVHKNHVTTSNHWKKEKLIRNKLGEFK